MVVRFLPLPPPLLVAVSERSISIVSSAAKHVSHVLGGGVYCGVPGSEASKTKYKKNSKPAVTSLIAVTGANCDSCLELGSQKAAARLVSAVVGVYVS